MATEPVPLAAVASLSVPVAGDQREGAPARVRQRCDGREPAAVQLVVEREPGPPEELGHTSVPGADDLADLGVAAAQEVPQYEDLAVTELEEPVSPSHGRRGAIRIVAAAGVTAARVADQPLGLAPCRGEQVQAGLAAHGEEGRGRGGCGHVARARDPEAEVEDLSAAAVVERPQRSVF
jgi:hypothetical protein